MGGSDQGADAWVGAALKLALEQLERAQGPLLVSDLAAKVDRLEQAVAEHVLVHEADQAKPLLGGKPGVLHRLKRLLEVLDPIRPDRYVGHSVKRPAWRSKAAGERLAMVVMASRQPLGSTATWRSRCPWRPEMPYPMRVSILGIRREVWADPLT
jgi:hypothetical protein